MVFSRISEEALWPESLKKHKMALAFEIFLEFLCPLPQYYLKQPWQKDWCCWWWCDADVVWNWCWCSADVMWSWCWCGTDIGVQLILCGADIGVVLMFCGADIGVVLILVVLMLVVLMLVWCWWECGEHTEAFLHYLLIKAVWIPSMISTFPRRGAEVHETQATDQRVCS